MESKMWVVIYCVKDDSHVLVVDTEVIYDEELQVGDKVKFAYPGFKHHLDGEVKGFSVNRDEMIKLQDRLNAEKPNREPSFHEELPRRAAQKCRERGFRGEKVTVKSIPIRKNSNSKVIKTVVRATTTTATNSQNKKITQKPPAKRTKPVKPGKAPVKKRSTPSVLSQMLEELDSDDSSSTSGSSRAESPNPAEVIVHKDKVPQVPVSQLTAADDRNDSDSGSDVVFSAEEIALLNKVAKKKKLDDYKALLNLNNATTDKKESDHNRMKLLQKDGSSMKVCTDQSGSSSEGINVTQALPNSGEAVTEKSEQDLSGEARKGNNSDQITEEAVTNISVQDLTDDAQNGNDSDKITEKVELGDTIAPKLVVHSSEEEEEAQSAAKAAEIIKLPAQCSLRPKRKAKPKKPKKDYVRYQYNGDFFNFTKDQFEDEKLTGKNKVIRLVPEYDVFIADGLLKLVKRKGISASWLTRLVTRAIFVLEARECCSVSGKSSFCGGVELPAVRTPLDQEEVDAIVEFVQSRSRKMTWNVPESSTIKQYMGNVLCEDRAAARAAAEEEEAADMPDVPPGNTEGGGQGLDAQTEKRRED